MEWFGINFGLEFGMKFGVESWSKWSVQLTKTHNDRATHEHISA